MEDDEYIEDESLFFMPVFKERWVEKAKAAHIFYLRPKSGQVIFTDPSLKSDGHHMAGVTESFEDFITYVSALDSPFVLFRLT
jgi:hypothetical protein